LSVAPFFCTNTDRANNDGPRLHTRVTTSCLAFDNCNGAFAREAPLQMATTKAEFHVQRRFALVRERCRISDWRLLFGAALIQVVTAAALRTMSFGTLIRAAGRGRPIVQWLLRGPESRVVWAITATGRRLGSFSTCLVRALVAELALSSPQSALLQIRMGVRPNGNGLDGHAWLVDGERVLLGGPVSNEFVVTAVWERAGVGSPCDSYDRGRAHPQ
jgi:hypothetical protein